MRTRLPVLGLLALFCFLFFAPSRALALSCVSPDAAFDTQDVVVRGTVISRPGKYRVVLAVDRYFKGTGIGTFQAELSGIDPGTDFWMNDPRPGKTYVMGFTVEGGRLVHRPCDIFWEVGAAPLPPELAQKMGEGIPPSAGPDGGEAGVPADVQPAYPWRSTFVVVLVGALSAAAVAGLALVVLAICRRR